jgi:acyl dehydratase
MHTEARSFADLEIGETFRGPGRTLTETDLVTFCMVTGDWHTIHADAEFAKGTRVGQRMFHGTFGIALAFGMSSNLLTLRNPVVAALGIREWSFSAPLFINDTVHLELVITGKKETSDGRRAVLGRRLRLLKQDGSVAQEGTADLMVALETT